MCVTRSHSSAPQLLAVGLYLAFGMLWELTSIKSDTDGDGKADGDILQKYQVRLKLILEPAPPKIHHTFLADPPGAPHECCDAQLEQFRTACRRDPLDPVLPADLP